MADHAKREEILQVAPRVGRSPAAKLTWALRFAQMPLGALTAGDVENLRRELRAFELSGAPQRFGRRERSASVGEAQVALPSQEDVAKVQREFRDKVDELLTRGWTRVSYDITVRIDRHDKPVSAGTLGDHFFPRPAGPAGRYTTITRYAFNPATAEPHRVASETFCHLLGTLGAEIETCPESGCRAWFLRRRMTQVYCSRRCQSRATTRALRSRRARKVRRRRAG